MAGPYDVSGLSDGFAQGFGLALKKNQQDYDQDYRQKQLDIQNRGENRADQLAQSTIGVNTANVGKLGADTAYTQANTAQTLQQTGLQAEQHNYEVSQRPVAEAQAKAQLGSTLAETKAKLAAAGASGAEAGFYGAKTRETNVTTAQAQHELDNQTALQGLLTARDRIANMPFENPKFMETAQQLDAAAGGVPVNVSPQDALQFFDTTLRSAFNKSVGQTVDARTAAAKGIPIGSKIIAVHAADAHYDKDRDGFAIGVNVTAQDPITGQQITYPSAITDNRSSAPDDKVTFVPAAKIHDLIKGAGIISHTFETQGIDPSQGKQAILNNLDALINGITSSDPQKYIKVNRNGVYDTATGQWTAAPARLGGGAVDPYAKAVGDIRKNPQLSDEEQAKRINALGRDLGKPQVTAADVAKLPKPQSLVRNSQGQYGLMMTDGSVSPISDEEAKQYQ